MSVVRGLIGVVRGQAGSAQPAAAGPLDTALLYERHAAAQEGAERALGATQNAEAVLAQQRTALTAAADEARLLAPRGKDLRVANDQVREALDRARLVALNAGLEGARLGEPAGGALVAMGEEVRGLVSRALDALGEQLTLFAQVESEHARLAEQVQSARRRAGELADLLASTQAALSQVGAALQQLATALEHTTGTDPEAARAAAAAAGHARGLLEALSALSTHPRRGVVSRALRPSLASLLRTLHQFDRDRDERGSDS
jgi:methyl-accepting chemotaxis protein